MSLKLKTLAGNLLLSLAALTIALATCEIVVRKSGMVADTDGPWNEGEGERYRIWLNLEGFRDYQHNVGRTDGVFRIAVVGDSFTWGQGVEAEEVYSWVLQRKLNDSIASHRFEVISIAQRGWDTEEELTAFRDVGLKYQPDLLIVGFVLNDPEPRDWSLRYDRPMQMSPLAMWISQRSYFFRLLFIQYYLFQDNASAGSYEQYTKDLYGEDAPNWGHFTSAVEDLCDTARAHGMETVAAIFPDFADLNGGYPFRREHAIAGQVWAENGAHVLDLFPAFEGMDERPLYVSMTDQHPSAKAHAIAAEAIYQYLVAEELVPLEGLGVPLPAMSNPLEANFGSEVKLLGYTLSPQRPVSGDTLHLILYWQALTRLTKDYTVFVHLLDAEGVVAAGQDSTPVKATYPTSAWQPGETVVDWEYALPLADVPPGQYTLEVGLYDWRTGIRLDVLDWAGNPQDTRVLLPDVRIEGP